MTRVSVRSKLKRMVDRLPASCSMDEAIYRLGLWASIEAGLADVKAGRVISHEDVLAELKRLRKHRT